LLQFQVKTGAADTDHVKVMISLGQIV